MSSNKTTAADAVIRVERATDFETVLDQSNQYAQIPRRAVIEVSGPDASEFLQGMQCNHMPTIDQGGGGMLTGFLTPQGRMLADAFVYPKNAGVNFPHPVFLVEVDEQAKDRMLKTLQFYKLRAKVRLCDVTDEYSVWSVWGPDSTALVGVVGQPLGHVPRGSLVFKGETTAAADVWLLDGRAPGMGLRLLLAAANNAEPSLPAGFERVAAERYTLRRVLKGVPEGACDFVAGVAVPLESNLDYMHGVHFNKGCYVGQELTIRTHHRGVVRKRIVPVIFAHTSDDASSLAVDQRFAQSQAPAPQADIVRVAESGESQPAEAAAPKVTRTRSRRVPPGKTGSTVFNAGLALMRLELVEQFVSQPADGCALRFETVAADGQRLAVLPWAPSWWPGNLEAQRQG
ncbi:ccr4 associated factor [Coemansia sp. RSA 986]|nr:ccr4 associated factor [Coemansia sp. RSA 1843]KAJ2091277.1 ccr4 associated factor [Coemansia sp. RSA 986]